MHNRHDSCHEHSSLSRRVTDRVACVAIVLECSPGKCHRFVVNWFAFRLSECSGSTGANSLATG